MNDIYIEHEIEIALSKEFERVMLFKIEDQLINFISNLDFGK